MVIEKGYKTKKTEKNSDMTKKAQKTQEKPK